MRLAFPLVLVGTAVALGWPAGTGQMLVDARLDLTVALTCCAAVIGGVWAARRRRTQLIATAVTLVLWLLLLAYQARQDGLWPLTTSWVVIALGGLLLSRAGRWESDQARLGAAGLCVVGATLSPLVRGIEGGLMVPTAAVVSGASLGPGAMVRGQTMTLRRARVEVRDRERRAMAHELHDVIAHEITGVVVLAKRCSRPPRSRRCARRSNGSRSPLNGRSTTSAPWSRPGVTTSRHPRSPSRPDGLASTTSSS